MKHLKFFLAIGLILVSFTSFGQFEFFTKSFPTWPGAKNYKPANIYAHDVQAGLPSIVTGKYKGFVLSGPDVTFAVPNFTTYVGVGVDWVSAAADSVTGKWTKNFTIGPRLYGGANLSAPTSIQTVGGFGARVTFFNQLVAISLIYDITIHKPQMGVGNPVALFPGTN